MFRSQEEEERPTEETGDKQRGKREENQESMVFCKPERECFLREGSDMLGQMLPGGGVRRGWRSDL